MDEERQRIKIAEACGFTQEEPWLDGRTCWGHKDHPKHIGFEEIPDYLDDLNAMHMAEKKLTLAQWDEYLRILYSLVQDPHICSLTHTMAYVCATAVQRAEAFLKTLNLWEE